MKYIIRHELGFTAASTHRRVLGNSSNKTNDVIASLFIKINSTTKSDANTFIEVDNKLKSSITNMSFKISTKYISE